MAVLRQKRRQATTQEASSTRAKKPKVSEATIGAGLSQLLGGPRPLSAPAFFGEHWERVPFVQRAGCAGAARLLPWGDLLSLLQELHSGARPKPCETEVLMLKDCWPTSDYPSMHAAYLDGCSVVINHLDKVYPPVRDLCRSLRAELPHAFVNMYLTPPLAQAVEAHADDRDVLVVQVAGKKTWKVYDKPPIPFPYPQEQVGKSEEYPVPKQVLRSKPLVETSLQAGDVLYMPRGFVHEALTGAEEPSLHLTIALATHDWSWSSVTAGALAAAGRTQAECARFRAGAEASAVHTRGAWWWRRSVPPPLLARAETLRAQQAEAERVAAAVGAELNLPGGAVASSYRAKVAHHNARQDSLAIAPVDGSFGINSYVRRPTAAEKQQQCGSSTTGGAQQGVIAREEIADNLPGILALIGTAPVRISGFDGGSLLCDFGKLCFAAVCRDLGLLCHCAADGSRLATSRTDAPEEHCLKVQEGQIDDRRRRTGRCSKSRSLRLALAAARSARIRAGQHMQQQRAVS
eukprot:TRINITY_DN122544_c0_g1_i1.p1 TRINITY_DN122544_c0_g1~~TRINITY_DN122544_c0_g1_i1.p1  ORF type:complete len:519 (-),score=97.07 TRINITY_DN122544_c0_g1_i1:26-1582(-)